MKAKAAVNQSFNSDPTASQFCGTLTLRDIFPDLALGCTTVPVGAELVGQFLVPDPDHIMTGVLLGEGDLTVSRAATVDVPDGEGVDQTFGTAEPAWGGGRVTGSIGSRVVYDTDAEGVEYADPTWLAVTAGDSHTLDSANINDYQGSLYLEAWMDGDDNLINGFLSRASGDLTLDDGTTQVTAAMSAGEWHGIGIAWSTPDGKMDLFHGGIWIGEVAYDGSLLSGALDLFRDAANGGRMRNLRIYSDGGSPPYDGLFDFYVSSERGDDANDGTSYLLPFATLSAAETAANAAGEGTTIGLARGSYWREKLTLSEDSMQVVAYGEGDPPMIDASDAIDSGDWTKTGGYTNLYEVSLAVETSVVAAEWPSVWIGGVRLTKAATQADCDTTPGTYYHGSAVNVTPITIYVHSTGSTDPRADGKLYEMSVRSASIDAYASAGSVIDGIDGKRPYASYGSFTSGRNGIIRNCRAYEGNTHNILARNGALVEDCEAIDAYASGEGPTLFIGYDNPASGEITFRRCKAALTTYATMIGFYAHAGSGTFDSINIEDAETENLSTPFSCANSSLLNVQGATVTNFNLLFSTTVNVYGSGITATGCTTAGHWGNFSTAGVSVTVEDCDVTFNTTGHFRALATGQTMTMNRCRVVGSNVIAFCSIAGPSYALENNDFVPNGRMSQIYNFTYPITVVADYNDFNGATGYWRYNGTDYATLALWQAFSGQDLNSQA